MMQIMVESGEIQAGRKHDNVNSGHVFSAVQYSGPARLARAKAYNVDPFRRLEASRFAVTWRDR